LNIEVNRRRVVATKSISVEPRERGFAQQVCRGDCGHWRGTGTPDMRQFARDEGVQANIKGLAAANYPVPSGFTGFSVGQILSKTQCAGLTVPIRRGCLSD
jgi:hypothetical protein